MLDSIVTDVIGLVRAYPIVSLGVLLAGVLALDSRRDLGVREHAMTYQRWIVLVIVGFVGGVMVGRRGGVEYLVDLLNLGWLM